jgi:hypothetical protein
LRALHNGNALAFQARVAGSIPAARSTYDGYFWLFSASVGIGFRELFVDATHGGSAGALDHVRVGALHRRD